MDFGEAIEKAEGKDGKRVLNVTRGSENLEVKIDLEPIGSFSATFPTNCKKSDLLRARALKYFVDHPESLSVWQAHARSAVALEVATEFRTNGGIKEPARSNTVPAASSATSNPATKDATAKPAEAKAKSLAVSPAVLEQWQARFVKKLDSLAKKGAKVKLPMAGGESYVVSGANEKSLIVSVQGNTLPMPWKQLSNDARATLAKEVAKDGDVEALLIAAVFQLASGDTVGAEDLFAKAALKDAETVKAAKAELARHL